MSLCGEFAVIFITCSLDKTIGLTVKLCGEMGERVIAFVVGATIGPPVESE